MNTLLHYSPLLPGCIAFVVSLIMTIIIGLILEKIRRNTKPLPTPTIEENQQLKAIQAALENNVTNKDYIMEDLATETGIPPHAINILLKKYLRRTFGDHITLARIEIAKERLRSSHSSETFIANSSGFKSAEAMRKSFWKFYHISPLNFRKAHQVS